MYSFLNDEDGVGTVMALFWFIICAGIVGMSVDATNAWRHKERLQLSADIAAHAGAVTIVNGGSEAQVRAAARTSALSNMPSSTFGRVINTDLKDIILSSYSEDTGMLSAPGTVNAVTVQLHRDSVVDNKIGTFLLRFAGFPDWQVKRYGTTVVSEFAKCPLYEGIWAHGKIKMSNQNIIQKDYCVHSQDFVDMPQHNEWKTGSYLGMPNLGLCGEKCFNDANDGVEAAKHQINLIMPEFDSIVTAVYAGMLDENSNDYKDAFWDGKTVETDTNVLAPLINLGLLDDPNDEKFDPDATMYTDPSDPDYVEGAVAPTYEPPVKGQVITMTKDQFSTMASAAAPPEGLTYNVGCTGGGKNAVFEMESPYTTETVITYGDDPKTKDLVETDYATEEEVVTLTPIRDIAVITNCEVHFTDYSDWRGAMVLTTLINNGASPVFEASANASVGDPTASCTKSDHTYLYSHDTFEVAAGFEANSVTIMSGGDMHFSSGSSPDTIHYGLSIYSDGEIDVTTQHQYNACNYDANSVLGADGFEYIRQVVPLNEAERIAAFN